MRVGHDHAGVDGEGFASHKPFLNAPRDHGLKQLTQEIALAEPAVTVLGKGRMVRHIAVQPQAAEPAVGQIEVDLPAQPPLRANAEAIADDQHPDHQLGIDRGPSNVAIVGPEVRPQAGQIDEAVDLAQQVIVRDMLLEAEAVERRLLHHPPLTHHRPSLLCLSKGNQRQAPRSSRVDGMARPSFRRRRLAGV
jgi:hypothetical protein